MEPKDITILKKNNSQCYTKFEKEFICDFYHLMNELELWPKIEGNMNEIIDGKFNFFDDGTFGKVRNHQKMEKYQGRYKELYILQPTPILSGFELMARVAQYGGFKNFFTRKLTSKDYFSF